MDWSRLFQSAFAFLIGASIFASIPGASVYSAHSTNEEITIYPATPSFSQSFFIAVSGKWANSCVPAFHTVDVGENRVRLQARTPGPLVACIETPTDWGFSVLIPPRPPNFYTADLYIVSGLTGGLLLFVQHEFNVIGGIQIIPALPLATENITLRLADLNPDGCVPAYVSHAVQGQTVTVEAQIPDLVCGQTPTPWQIEAALGLLAAGNYQAQMFVTDYRFTPPRRTRLLEDSFVVVAQLLHTYLPLWGCFGTDISPLGCTVVQMPDPRGDSP
ncbi:MAG: hypothetical protein DWI57_17040 [Chloroflexi bacterium]|nr:MAG: hypothetical protein DWI57_17040 [Chloroflexota bacterium]